MKLEEAKKMCREIYTELKEIDITKEKETDGRFVPNDKYIMVSSLEQRLMKLKKIDGYSRRTLNEAWFEAWKGNREIFNVENMYEHAINYINSILNLKATA